MSVSSHLNIRIEEYDDLIRRFVPHYEEMLAAAAGTLGRLASPNPSAAGSGGSPPTIVDLGVGTGALAIRCLSVCPQANLIGIDADADMMAVARARLEISGEDSGEGRPGSIRFSEGDFLRLSLPPADAVVACLALHHVPTEGAKRDLYARCFRALHPGGLFVSADCFTARDPELAARQREAWIQHLERTFTPAEARGHLAQWAEEDTYFPLSDEMQWVQDAGFHPEVVWRRDGFAVLAGIRRAV